MTLSAMECYELCVQSPRHVVGMLRGVHGGEPVVLREDFCGTMAVSRRWAMEGQSRRDDARAVCVDLDRDSLAKGVREAAELKVEDRLRVICADAVACPQMDDDGADVVWVGNFSIGYIHARRQLLGYLRRSRERLMRGNAGFGGGVFVCDVYGGAGAYRLGSLDRTHMGHGPEVIKYHWEHESADPITGMVRNSISFKVIVNGELAAEYPRAYIYEWRLWSLAEVREAMLEVGFASVEVYKEVSLAPGERPEAVGAEGLGEDWIVMVVGRG